MSPQASTSLQRKLRAATSCHHDAVEQAVGLARDAVDHERQLRVFYGFISRVEVRQRELLTPDHPIICGREKTTRLRADLAYFGYSETDLASLPQPARLPRMDSLAQAMGVAYVIEGATLGGQLIARHLETVLGLRDGQGYDFFSGYGSQTAARWRAFLQELSLSCPTEDEDEMVAAAVDCFESLVRCFEAEPSGTLCE